MVQIIGTSLDVCLLIMIKNQGVGSHGIADYHGIDFPNSHTYSILNFLLD
jgi:hypothetical protein